MTKHLSSINKHKQDFINPELDFNQPQPKGLLEL